MPGYELRFWDRMVKNQDYPDDQATTFLGYITDPVEYTKLFATLDLAERTPDANIYLEVYLEYLKWAKFNDPHIDRFDRYKALINIYFVAALVDFTRFFNINKGNISFTNSAKNQLTAPPGQFTHNFQTLKRMYSASPNEQYLLGMLYTINNTRDYSLLNIFLEDTKIQIGYAGFGALYYTLLSSALSVASAILLRKIPVQGVLWELSLFMLTAGSILKLLNTLHPKADAMVAKDALGSLYQEQANNTAELMYRKPQDLRKMPGIDSIPENKIVYPSEHGTLKPLLMNSTFKIATGEIKNFDEYLESFQKESKLQIR